MMVVRIFVFLTCTASDFVGNRAQGGHGGHYGSGEGLGGALFSQGEVNLDGCFFRNNSAKGPAHLNPGTDDGNGKGGAVYAAGLHHGQGEVLDAEPLDGGAFYRLEEQ
jgi:hypothetical protein